MTNLDTYFGVIACIACISALLIGCLVVARQQDRAGFDADLEAQRDPGMGEFRPAAGRPHIADMQARAETPAEIEWERRLARWTEEARAEDRKRRGEAS